MANTSSGVIKTDAGFELDSEEQGDLTGGWPSKSGTRTILIHNPRAPVLN